MNTVLRHPFAIYFLVIGRCNFLGFKLKNKNRGIPDFFLYSIQYSLAVQVFWEKGIYSYSVIPVFTKLTVIICNHLYFMELGVTGCSAGSIPVEFLQIVLHLHATSTKTTNQLRRWPLVENARVFPRVVKAKPQGRTCWVKTVGNLGKWTTCIFLFGSHHDLSRQ